MRMVLLSNTFDKKEKLEKNNGLKQIRFVQTLLSLNSDG